MLGQFFKPTSEKPYPCLDTKDCTKKPQKYNVLIKEEPALISQPLVVSYYKDKPFRSGFSSKRRWEQDKPPSPKQRRTLCQWYKKRKAICELKAINRSEREYKEKFNESITQREKAQKELEREYLEKFNEQYEEQLKQPPQHALHKSKTKKSRRKINVKSINSIKSKFRPIKSTAKSKHITFKKTRHQVFIEKSRHRRVPIQRARVSSIPIVISHYKEKPHRSDYSSKRRLGKQKSELPEERRTICQWYRRRKALNELRSINRLEQKKRRLERENALRLEREKARRELEREYLAQLTEQYEEQLRQKPESPPPKKAPKTARKHKVKSCYVRPQAETKYVSVKRRSSYDSLSNRCTNFCYRICCQFYCCLTFIMIIGFFVIIAV